MERLRPLIVRFYRSPSGNQPVREWLSSLTKAQRYSVGVDLWKVQSYWPIGMPLVKHLGRRLHEIRSSMPDGIARIIFTVDGDLMVLFHGFIKKTQKTTRQDLELSESRRRDYEQNKQN